MSYYVKLRDDYKENRNIVSDYPNMCVPHQALSVSEIFNQWVSNDNEMIVHNVTEVFTETGDPVADVNRYSFEDDFDAMEYVANIKQSPVTVEDIESEVLGSSSGDPVSSGDSGSSADS